MPVIVLVASTLIFWVIYWFVRMGGVDHVRERFAQRRRAEARELDRLAPLRAIDDPRDAATVLMLLIPRGRDPTPAQIAAVEQTMREVFGFDRDATGRLTQARFLASHARNFAEAARLFSDLFHNRLTPDERRELAAMVEQIARIDGPSASQVAEIRILKERIGLADGR